MVVLGVKNYLVKLELLIKRNLADGDNLLRVHVDIQSRSRWNDPVDLVIMLVELCLI